jgi:hypothetical protein
MPNYKQKLTAPLTDQAFTEAMNKGNFIHKPEHQGYLAFLYYTGARCSEGLKITANQFRRTPNILFIEIERLKHSHKTDPLPIPTDAPFVECIIDSYSGLKPDSKVWPYCRKTGYNIVKRVYPQGYPHYFRLSRITNFLLLGFTTPEIKSWTGLNASTIDHYVGLVKLDRMGKSLFNKTP